MNRHLEHATFLLTAIVFSPLAFAQERGDTSSLETRAERRLSVEETKAVQRAVEYLKSHGVSWIEKRKCVSCHQIPAMVWSLNLARQNGLDVDGESLNQWNVWSVDTAHFVAPEDLADRSISQRLESNIDTMAALLVGLSESYTSDDSLQWRSQFAEALANEQQPDGSWNPCGQLPMQKRPEPETRQATTLWVTLSLLGQQDVEFDLDKAISAAKLTDPSDRPTSIEVTAVKLLVAHRLKRTELVANLSERLRVLQNDDGGWPWLVDDDSDALATGMAVYALKVSQQATPSACVAAQRFLFSTQASNGSWKVPGTKKASKNRPTPTSNYWGTAWAVIGLLTEPIEFETISE